MLSMKPPTYYKSCGILGFGKKKAENTGECGSGTDLMFGRCVHVSRGQDWCDEYSKYDHRTKKCIVDPLRLTMLTAQWRHCDSYSLPRDEQGCNTNKVVTSCYFDSSLKKCIPKDGFGKAVALADDDGRAARVFDEVEVRRREYYESFSVN